MATSTLGSTAAQQASALRRRRRDPRRPAWQEQPSIATQGAKSATIVATLLVILFPLYSIVLTSVSTQASINIAGGLVVWPHGVTLNAYRLIISGSTLR